MKHKKEIIVLVLGARGMVGRALIAFFKIYPLFLVWGTVRNRNELKRNLFLLRAENVKEDFYIIQKKLKKIDYVINCIGAKKENKISDLIFVNSYFPHVLFHIAEKFNLKLIHISTDAVFNPLSGKVDEKDIPTPIGLYGLSKLLGESNDKNAITIRTSLIGFNPLKKDTLLQRVLRNENNIIEGYINQKWAGCTTFQFAQFCKDMISKNKFKDLRAKYHILHFAPLGPITKHKLLLEFLKVIGKKFNPQKNIGERKTRTLSTIFFDILEMDKYTNDIKKALIDLYRFEKKVVQHEGKI